MPGGMISAGGRSGYMRKERLRLQWQMHNHHPDRDNQKQNLANLSRDPALANDSISPIHLTRRGAEASAKTVGLISDIGSQVADIARTQGELNALKAAQDKICWACSADATEEQRQAYIWQNCVIRRNTKRTGKVWHWQW